PVDDETARRELAARWSGSGDLPSAPGRDTTAMLEAAARGELAALVVGGVEIDDLPDPSLAREALARAFVVSLEFRESDVHENADVILPVAPQQEKAGAYADWEGRLRPFEQALASSADPDHVVLDRLADAMGVHLGTESVASVRREITDLGTTATRPASPRVAPAGPASPGPG